MSKKVSIEVGHGGRDPGAVANGFRESDINLVVSLELKQLLEAQGVEILISRTTDVNFDLSDFYSKVLAYKPDVHISVHANAGGGDGFEVFRSNGVHEEQSEKLCKLIEKYVKELGQNSRGIKTAGFLMLSAPCPVAYCEMGFLDNKTDLAAFDTVTEQKTFAKAYAKGIIEFLGLMWKDEKEDYCSTEKMRKVQIGAFDEKRYAEAMLAESTKKGFKTCLKYYETEKKWKVQIGAFEDKRYAEAMLAKAKAAGYKDAWIVIE